LSGKDREQSLEIMKTTELDSSNYSTFYLGLAIADGPVSGMCPY